MGAPGLGGDADRAGRRVIALDNRGHGASSKLYDPSAYHSATMADDVRALLDHLQHRTRRRHGLFDGRAHHGISDSEPSRTRAFRHFRRARHPAGGGCWSAGKHRRCAGSAVARRCAAIRPGAFSGAFADQTKSDLRALGRLHSRFAADARRGPRWHQSARRCWSRSGTRIPSPGSAQALAALIPGARRARYSRTATTCWRSATKSLRPALSTFLTNAR